MKQGSYEVVLTVEDDIGTNTCSLPIEVAEVNELDNQEVAVCECLDADFGEDAGSASHSFETGISGVSCSLLTEETLGVDVSESDDECVVTWCDGCCGPSGPDKEDVGTHLIMIKATDTTESKYYSFLLTVYDYGIYLEEGWNLISIPLVPEDDDTSIDSVFAQLLESESIAYIDGILLLFCSMMQQMTSGIRHDLIQTIMDLLGVHKNLQI